jgi:peptide/nickel transport system permease protein
MSELQTAPRIAPAEGGTASGTAAEQRVTVAPQWKLTWWRFRKHKVALISAWIIALFYLAVIFADFLAYSEPAASNSQRAYVPPQAIHWFDDGSFSPHVYELARRRNPATFQLEYVPDPTRKVYLELFARGYSYSFWGLFESDIHLVGTAGARTESTLFLLGTDGLGRDQWSRLVLGTRISLTIGLAGVALSLLIGIVLGGISGYFGGVVDLLVQRLIEILRAIPTVPLWMGLAVAIPSDWGIVAVYFGITLIISLIGWTELGREIRGRVLSLRHEDFVLAAELAGARTSRIIFVHMVPLCASHIIATTTLALPVMIISETALSFLGLGLRAPAISWGVLLQGAQNVQSVALYPWLMAPAVPVVLAILAFNFLGDGLRDAADPYS